MRRFLDGKIAKALLFLALIPFVSGNFEDAIICVEKDGQVAVEFLRNDVSVLSEHAKEHSLRHEHILPNPAGVNGSKSSLAVEFPGNGVSGLSVYAKEHGSRHTHILVSDPTEVRNLNPSKKIKDTIAIANIRYLAHDKPSLNRRNYQNLSESGFFSHDLLSSVIIRI